MESERLRLGRLDDLPDVDIHAVAEQLEFIYQCNVHAAVNVLQQLGHFGRRGRGNRYCAPENGSVKRGGKPRRSFADAANNLRYVVTLDRVVAGIFALGRESNKETIFVFAASRTKAAWIA